jgi:hypothetical protein
MDKYLGSNQKFMLLVEGHKISFDDFVNDNSAKDVQPITAEEIKDIHYLKVDESTFVGLVKVKRIK